MTELQRVEHEVDKALDAAEETLHAFSAKPSLSLMHLMWRQFDRLDHLLDAQYRIDLELHFVVGCAEQGTGMWGKFADACIEDARERYGRNLSNDELIQAIERNENGRSK
jgi:hypothetical protein